MHNKFPRGSTDALEFKCTGPKGTGSACVCRFPVRIEILTCSTISSVYPESDKKILLWFIEALHRFT